jgi:hypothetical protein
VPGATGLSGGVTRITGIARRTREGFYLICGPAWIHVYRGETCVYDEAGTGHWLPPAPRPRDGEWVTCEGQLSATLWCGAEDDFASLEADSLGSRVYPPACGWTVRHVEGADGSTHALVDALSLPH